VKSDINGDFLLGKFYFQENDSV